ncbi:MAG: response regulator [Desulfobacteraceae bacterium]|jgi:DNA-binding response OmpR family regulator|nr:MAG: response regulator [Desulfobacteraceae bacterium]
MDNALEKATIMVVDDTPSDLKLLEEMLECKGYRVLSFPMGNMALKAAAKNPPDLILLDIMMPDMDGFEVCRRLKADESLREIPVLFISALTDLNEKIKAFSLGGVDYVTKPFQFEEVNARVGTHLRLRALQGKLKERNLNLEKLVAERTRELEKAYARLEYLDQVKSNLLAMISHEIRTPLNGILGIGELAFDLVPDSRERSELRESFQSSRGRMECLLDDAETLNTIDSLGEKGCLSAVAVLEVLREAQRQMPHISIKTDFPDGFADICVLGEHALFRRGFETLIQVAASFTAGEKPLNLNAVVEKKQVALLFNLDKLHLSDSQAKDFFEITSSARSASHAESLGLAPVVAHRIFALFKGDVSLLKTDATTGIMRILLELAK